MAWLTATLLVALLWALTAGCLGRCHFSFPRLLEVAPEPPSGGWPSLCVVVPARNEAAQVEAATRALLSQDYPRLEVVAVDDRSTDGTGAILDRLAAEDARLTVLHLEMLPDGWLGKNRALAEGAAHARGQWLLFADGDVVLAPDALRRALAFACAHRLGHLVAFPRLLAPGFPERAFVSAFALFASLKFQVWALRQPGTAAFVGVGAFNLVQRDAYRAAGGHRALAMEVVDDAKLGLILRRSGVPQGAVDSGGLVRVRWQEGFLASLAGLVKNLFAAAEWSWARTLPGALLLVAVSVLPLVAVVAAPAAAPRLLGALGLLLPVTLHGLMARRACGGSGLEGLSFPACGVLLALVLLWSAAAATARGGIVWRGTRYPLAALRRGCVRERDWPAARAVGWPG